MDSHEDEQDELLPRWRDAGIRESERMGVIAQVPVDDADLTGEGEVRVARGV